MENVWVVASIWVGLALIATLLGIWLNVSVPALVAAPLAFVFLFAAKITSKTITLLPAVRFYGYTGSAGWHYTLMMSTGLTFGTISALFGLSHGVITQAQYSYLVATVIGSAVIPTVIRQRRFPADAFAAPGQHGGPDRSGGGRLGLKKGTIC